MPIDQYYKLKKLLAELEKLKGRHTELVSVYIPVGLSLNEIQNLLAQEVSLTQNVKSKTVRKNVIDALTKIQQYLRLYKKNPEHGLAVFCGNVSEQEGKTDIKIWAVEPPEPVTIKLYWCDQKFELGPLLNQLKEKEVYGLVVLDTKEATVGILKGKSIQVLWHKESIVPGKFVKGGQCLSLGTLIPSFDGNIMKIENIKSGLNLKSADFNTFSLTDSTILDVYRTKKSKVYKIITKYPRLEVESSKDHFFFVWENNEIIEKPAEKLKIGDILLMPEKLKVEGSIQSLDTNFNKYGSEIILPEFLNEDVALIIGYFLGDGNYDSNRLVFSEQSKELAIFYRDRIKETFNINLGLRYRKTKNYYELKAYSKTLVEFFENQIIKSKYSLTSLVPEKILLSKNSVLSSFLRGFFDAEGYVTKDRIGLGIFNKSLAQEIQLMLLRFGILSSFLEYDSRRNPYSKNHRFTIEISEKKSLEIFKNLIGFNLKSKSKKLNKLICAKSNKSSVRQILISGRIIRKIIENYGFKKQDFYQVSDFLLGKKNISKGIFEKSFLNKITDKNLYLELKQALDCPLLPVKIKKIEKFEKTIPMIDLAVKHESFIANGIFVHNSAHRFEKVREGLVNDWYKEIGENIKKQFESLELIGIILGGPGISKDNFLNENYIETDIKKKVLGIQSTGYTDEQGLEELVNRSSELLKEAAVSKEKDLLNKFLNELQKDSGLVTYGMIQVKRALEAGAVEIILLSDGLEWIEGGYGCSCGYSEKKIVKISEKDKQICPKCNQKMSLVGEIDIIDAIEELAKKYGTKLEIISRQTNEGEQLYQLGGIAAILRYKL